MATRTKVRRTRRLQPHRTIERPRLLALLDGSDARVRMLVAPPGYGKTTLAEQWSRGEERVVAWFTATRASGDVAALALGLARACAPLVPGCDERLREHLRALPNPASDVETLAEILAEDLTEWPDAGWLVLDDYHELARAADAERFVESLLTLAPLRALIASRLRPSWVTARRMLYGEVFEVSQAALAMDADEATVMLSGRDVHVASGLAALANGWPAVIGLAAVSGADVEGESALVPEALYRYFAEEVYASFGNEVQRDLAILAVPPVLDRGLASLLLGDDAARTVCDAALDAGILTERGTRLELHPLCRAVLHELGGEHGLILPADVIPNCLQHYRERREWDAAFEVLAGHRVAAELPRLLELALNELLDGARLSTVDEWCALGAELSVADPMLSIARAELALRRGRYVTARAHAESAATSEPHAFRALCLAGRAAHFASREGDGLDLYRRAEAVAVTEDERREALWGQLRSLIDLESSTARPVLEDLSAGVDGSDPREVVRCAGHRLYFQCLFGSLDLREADAADELLDLVGDPIVASSFQSAYSVALRLSARYQDALVAADRLLATATAFRLGFALVYAHCYLASVYSGLRRWDEAGKALDEAARLALERRDRHAQRNVYLQRVALLVQQGRSHAALGIEVPTIDDALPATRVEVMGARALALVLQDRLDEAERTLEGVRGITQAVEAICLLAVVDALLALKRGRPCGPELVRELERVAFKSGALDMLVLGYRSSPELLVALLRGAADRERFVALVRRLGDSDLAEAVGCPIATANDPLASLTPREREVYELLRLRFTNAQISRALYISVHTVKVHARHIYDKLGVRSRDALALQAALERSDQATSATSSSDDGAS